MNSKLDQEDLPDLPNEQIDEDEDETESAELEQVAENTSRKLLILLGIGCVGPLQSLSFLLSDV